MNIGQLKEFLDKLPKEFDDFEMVNGEYAILTEDDEKFIYRLDKPIVILNVDEDSKELCFLHQSQESIDKILGDDTE